MYKILLLAAFTLAGVHHAGAQCPAVQLGAFQYLANADASLKEAKILEMGFDLHASYTEKGTEVRQFRKCWNTTFGDKAIFDQLLLWETRSDHILLCLLNKEAFEEMRSSIINRHGTTFTAGTTPPYYIGNKFRYDFGNRKIEGIDYYTIRISKK